MNKKKRNKIGLLAFFLSSMLLLILITAVWYGKVFIIEFLYYPISERQNKCNAFDSLDFQQVLKDNNLSDNNLIEIGSGLLKLQALYLKADTGANYLLLIHGKKECPYAMLKGGLALQKMGFSVLIPVYYGHGNDSLQTMIDYGKYSIMQMDSCVRYIQNLGGKKIGVIGRSMGASIGIIAAARNKAIQAIVAECPAKSVQSSISYKHSLYSDLPDFPFLDIKIRATKLALSDNLDSLAAINFVSRISPRPLFIMAATEDVVINPQDFIDLFEQAGEPKTYWEEPIDHTKFHSQLSDTFYDRTSKFFIKAFFP